MSLKIIGVGKGIPKKSVSNEELASFLDTSDEWIVSRTGIVNRYICTDETLTDLATAAALEAIEKSGLAPGDIDLFICSTVGGDLVMPALSCCVSERIGTKCAAFDINAACTGFVNALDIAACYLKAGRAKNILIVCAELMSTKADWQDRNTCVLFGDGAAACVVTSGTALKYISLSANADTSILNMYAGTGNTPFMTEKREYGYVHMLGQEVFRFAVTTVDNEMKRALGALNMGAEQIDWFLLHQANKRIIDSARIKVKQPKEKFPVNIANYGNISCVSIPLLLYEMLEDGRLMPGDTVFMSAFGAGLTFGSCVMVWESAIEN